MFITFAEVECQKTHCSHSATVGFSFVPASEWGQLGNWLSRSREWTNSQCVRSSKSPTNSRIRVLLLQRRVGEVGVDWRCFDEAKYQLPKKICTPIIATLWYLTKTNGMDEGIMCVFLKLYNLYSVLFINEAAVPFLHPWKGDLSSEQKLSSMAPQSKPNP